MICTLAGRSDRPRNLRREADRQKGYASPASENEDDVSDGSEEKQPTGARFNKGLKPDRKSSFSFASCATKADGHKKKGAFGLSRRKTDATKEKEERDPETLKRKNVGDDAATVDPRAWDIIQFHHFLEGAQQAMVAMDKKELEQEELQGLLNSIPHALRKDHGLPMTDEAIEEALNEISTIKAGIQALIQQVISQYTGQVQNAVEGSSCKFGMLEDLEGSGLIEALAKDADYLVDRDDILKLVAVRESLDSSVEEKDTAVEELKKAQRKFLTSTQCLDFGYVRDAFAKVSQFTERHCKKDPSREEVRSFLKILGEGEAGDMRKALGITSEKKFKESTLRPRAWPQDVSRLITVIFLAYAAWVDLHNL